MRLDYGFAAFDPIPGARLRKAYDGIIRDDGFAFAVLVPTRSKIEQGAQVAHGQIRLCLASLTNQSVPPGDRVIGDFQQRALLPVIDRSLKNPAKCRWQMKTNFKK